MLKWIRFCSWMPMLPAFFVFQAYRLSELPRPKKLWPKSTGSRRRSGRRLW